ncbi:acyltransferase family protein [Rathayibacter iranicus]|uniref:Acyltransferase n=2 Tax=Rathayibacter iranicus TaxID=59737 RepID=A0AAD1ADI1_9MICO|nr:acyltransferase [Rathayibacter iranicus]AZZ56252.1 acyltransferase [Rathayibacter iranicus]MWV30038.1 acyltransferase family protein [Rathayibacter iranicus NCPPB 2253 = VKM Ac-1602]PPI45864.1 acyltransferase [Rathayibacter iranicus]PPI59693.1 acyltransferase [Rathayibacter iranicus]PPI70702.1 acyltransferase [Rathayibacter iranicus]
MNAVDDQPVSPSIGTTSDAEVPPRVARLPSLTAARFPAALAVFVFHAALPQAAFLAGSPQVASALWRISEHLGAAAVSFFFVLSGFVITWSARPGDRAVDFWRRRFVKILPVYWACGLIAVLVTPSAAHLLPGFLVMAQAWSTDPAVYFGLDAPGWSLCAEALFYALFPLAMRARLASASRRLVIVIVALALLVIISTVLLAQVLPVGEPMAHDTSLRSVQYWTLYVFPVLRLPEFVLGVCAAVAVRDGWFRPGSPALPAMALVLAYVVALFLPSLWSQKAVVVLPCAWLIAAWATRDAYGPRMTGSEWSRRLGEWSFAFYLVHQPMLVLFARASRSSAVVELLLLFAAALASVVAAAALHYGLERPLMRRWGSRQPT